MVGTNQKMIEREEKSWKFAESHWYCFDCGFVSAADVQTDEPDAETGVCRCGQEIAKTQF